MCSLFSFRVASCKVSVKLLFLRTLPQPINFLTWPMQWSVLIKKSCLQLTGYRSDVKLIPHRWVQKRVLLLIAIILPFIILVQCSMLNLEKFIFVSSIWLLNFPMNLRVYFYRNITAYVSQTLQHRFLFLANNQSLWIITTYYLYQILKNWQQKK